MPLSQELHQCSQPFPFSRRWDRKARGVSSWVSSFSHLAGKGAGAGYPLPPGRVGSDHTPAREALVNYVPRGQVLLRKQRVPANSKVGSFPSPARRWSRVFSALLWEQVSR